MTVGNERELHLVAGLVGVAVGEEGEEGLTVLLLTALPVAVLGKVVVAETVGGVGGSVPCTQVEVAVAPLGKGDGEMSLRVGGVRGDEGGLHTATLHEGELAGGDRLACGGVEHHAHVLGFGLVAQHDELEVCHADGRDAAALGVGSLSVVGGDDKVVARGEHGKGKRYLLVYVGVGCLILYLVGGLAHRAAVDDLLEDDVFIVLTGIAGHDTVGNVAGIAHGERDAVFPARQQGGVSLQGEVGVCFALVEGLGQRVPLAVGGYGLDALHVVLHLTRLGHLMACLGAVGMGIDLWCVVLGQLIEVHGLCCGVTVVGRDDALQSAHVVLLQCVVAGKREDALHALEVDVGTHVGISGVQMVSGEGLQLGKLPQSVRRGAWGECDAGKLLGCAHEQRCVGEELSLASAQVEVFGDGMHHDIVEGGAQAQAQRVALDEQVVVLGACGFQCFALGKGVLQAAALGLGKLLASPLLHVVDGNLAQGIESQGCSGHLASLAPPEVVALVVVERRA